jgi:hypothetical protein
MQSSDAAISRPKADIVQIRKADRIHRFPAKMTPALAYSSLIGYPKEVTGKSVRFHDPMCGSGTTALVARSLGFSVTASDAMYPAAVIATAKLRLLSSGCLSDMVKLGEGVSVSGKPNPRRPWSRYKIWYTSRVLRCLEEIAEEIYSMKKKAFFPHLQTAFFQTVWDSSSADNNVIVPTRSDYSRTAPRFKPKTIIEIFRERIVRIVESQSALSELGFDTKAPSISQSDALQESSWPTGRIDLIFTSPPYGCGIDYQRAFRLQMRIWSALGVRLPNHRIIGRRTGPSYSDSGLPQAEVRSRWYGRLSEKDDERKRMFMQYLSDMRAFLRLSRKKLSKNGRLCMVIGNPEIAKTRIPLVRVMQALAKEEKLALEERPSYDRIRSRIQNFRLRSATSHIDKEYLLSFRPH